MISRRKPVSPEAEQKFAADQALAARFDELLAEARSAEQELRDAQAARAPLTEQHRLAKGLDAALTDAMRAAYAAERVAIGPQGYDDRIYRRKARATSPVRVWSAEAGRLLTLRESHRLTGIPRIPQPPAMGGSDEQAPGYDPAPAGAEELAPSFQPTGTDAVTTR
ncbi:MAG TPA: hypothetical protein VHT94_00330 [Streptosporangiaceae bacterium]|nr:hypothetical protein [Streptosporangiaceae bacterium]